MLPVTILTGFLGAGKTTLLNRILTEDHGRRYAVVSNEFGEVDVDSQLIVRRTSDLFETSNGCICCTAQGDLFVILNRLLESLDRLDGILIETTGLANPAPVAGAFFTDGLVKESFQLDAIVTVVDALHVMRHLDANDESVRQIALADVILLNKTDLVGPAELEAVEARVRGINGLARIHHTQRCAIPLDQVLGVGGFDLERLAPRIGPLKVSGGGLVPSIWMKGHPAHDSAVTSVGFSVEGDIEGGGFNEWLVGLLRERSDDIYRMKGVIAVRGCPVKLVCQGVHAFFEARFEGLWADEPRRCTLVFIGKNLDREALTEKFGGFLAVPG